VNRPELTHDVLGDRIHRTLRHGVRVRRRTSSLRERAHARTGNQWQPRDDAADKHTTTNN
jgi:hypothetical protein